MAITFQELKAGYPTEPRDELFNALGGGWPALIGDANYNNTCAVRLSIALKAAGVTIPDTLKEAVDGKGSPLIVKVKTMEKLVRLRLGKSYWGMSKQTDSPIDADTLPKLSGVLVYHVAWADATGHFDLWTGSGFVGAGKMSDIAKGYDLEFWRVD